MRAVVQRVSSAHVDTDGATIGSIERGLVVLLGVETGDQEADLDYICKKIVGLRVFDDAHEVPNLSVEEIGGSILLVSQFTLCADVRHGRRPSYIGAAAPDEAIPLYEAAIRQLSKSVPVQTGRFQAMMQVHLVNDGPHTILLDSRRKF